MSNSLIEIPEISVKIGRQEIPLQSRSAAMVTLLAQHQAAINGPAHCKVLYSCSQSDVELSVTLKLGRVKVRR